MASPSLPGFPGAPVSAQLRTFRNRETGVTMTYDPITRRITSGGRTFQFSGDGEPTPADFDEVESMLPKTAPAAPPTPPPPEEPDSPMNLPREFVKNTVGAVVDLLSPKPQPGEESVDTPFGPMSKTGPITRAYQGLSRGAEDQFTKMFEATDAAAPRRKLVTDHFKRILRDIQLGVREPMSMDAAWAEARQAGGPESPEEQQIGGRFMAGMIPGAGPLAASAGEAIGEGKPWTAAGRAAAVLVPSTGAGRGALKSTLRKAGETAGILRKVEKVAPRRPGYTATAGAAAPEIPPSEVAVPGRVIEMKAAESAAAKTPSTSSFSPGTSRLEVLEVRQDGSMVVKPTKSTSSVGEQTGKTGTAKTGTTKTPKKRTKETREAKETAPPPAAPEDFEGPAGDPFREAAAAAAEINRKKAEAKRRAAGPPSEPVEPMGHGADRRISTPKQRQTYQERIDAGRKAGLTEDQARNAADLELSPDQLRRKREDWILEMLRGEEAPKAAAPVATAPPAPAPAPPPRPAAPAAPQPAPQTIRSPAGPQTIDDWYRSTVQPNKSAKPGAKPPTSDLVNTAEKVLQAAVVQKLVPGGTLAKIIMRRGGNKVMDRIRALLKKENRKQ